MDADRRCGTCRFHEPYHGKVYAQSGVAITEHKGTCEWITRAMVSVPIWVWDNAFVSDNEGTDCPTWEAKPDA